MFRSKKNEERKGSAHWMTTFSDLMTLLLVFFVLLFAYSEVDAEKFRAIANSFRNVLDYQSSAIPMDNSQPRPIELEQDPQFSNDSPDPQQQIGNKDSENKKELDQLLAKIKKYLRDNDLEGVITATRETRGVELVLQERVLFDSGRAVIKREATPFLTKVADMIRTLPNEVEVEGHTDSQRIIQPSPYTTNWNLSGARAANVVNYFIDKHKIDSKRFKISGYADIQPIGSNNTEAGRQKNRRVVIVILDDN